MIKFLDLQKLNARFEFEFQEKFKEFLDSGHYILGEQVLAFEKSFASYCGTKYCIGVSNGLDALALIFEGYKTLGKLNVGDEVIVPANTYIASVLAISNTGLKPILVEPTLSTYNIDTSKIEKAITLKTKAILGVHLYGQLFDVLEVERICKLNNLLLIEDAAQAHGAEFLDGRKAGNLSHAAAFSFYPTKNLGALGDAGCVTTNNFELAETIKKLRNYGRISTYENDLKGYNCRLDELQAAFLIIKLKDLDTDNLKRKEVANLYSKKINNSKIKLPYFSGGKNHVFHQYVIEVNNRKEFIDYMIHNDIETSIHYPVPPHHQKALFELNHLNLPITEYMHNVVLSLPINPVLTQEEVCKIVEVLNKY